MEAIGIRENKLEAFIPARAIVKRGTIRGILLDVGTEELLERIRLENLSLNVIGARRLQMRYKNLPTRGIEPEEHIGSEVQETAWVDSKTVCLDFKAPSLPEHVIVWNALLNVTPFIPAIKMCYKCGRYGHISTRCNRKERCLTCGGDHPMDKDRRCAKGAKCLNCGEDHSALSRNCGKRTEEESVNRLMVLKNMSTKEARKAIKTTDRRAPTPPQF
jgi:hypothetical protein